MLTATQRPRRAAAWGQRGGLWRRMKRSRVARRCCSGPAMLLFLMVFASSRCTSMSGIADQGPNAVARLGPLIPCKPTSPDEELLRQADTDPAGLLERGLRWHDANLRDYEGLFTLREFQDGRARIDAVVRFKFRQTPFSLALQWVQGAGRIDRLLYVQGKNDGQMIVHPTGLIGALFPKVKVDPDGDRARSWPIAQFGVRTALARVLDSFRKDAAAGTLRARCLGVGKLNGYRVLTLEKIGADEKLIVDLETKTLLPVRIRRYAETGQLSALYEYSELRFNRGFTDAAFSREANGL